MRWGKICTLTLLVMAVAQIYLLTGNPLWFVLLAIVLITEATNEDR